MIRHFHIKPKVIANRNTKLIKHSIFSPGGMFDGGDIMGADYPSYMSDVQTDGSWTAQDVSTYTDAGVDPTIGSGGNWLGTLGNVVNDAFKAYQIAQTPTSYRPAAPTSPAAIAARSQATLANQQSSQKNNLMMFGVIIVVGIIIYLVVKK